MHGVGYEYAVKAFETFGLPEFVPVVEQVGVRDELSFLRLLVGLPVLLTE